MPKELTDEQAVKQKWPHARIRWSITAGCWVVSQRNYKGQKSLSSLRMNEKDAWVDARSKVEK